MSGTCSIVVVLTPMHCKEFGSIVSCYSEWIYILLGQRKEKNTLGRMFLLGILVSKLINFCLITEILSNKHGAKIAVLFCCICLYILDPLLAFNVCNYDVFFEQTWHISDCFYGVKKQQFQQITLLYGPMVFWHPLASWSHVLQRFMSVERVSDPAIHCSDLPSFL